MSDTVFEDVVEWMESGDATDEEIAALKEAFAAVIEPDEPSYWEIENEPKKIQLGGEVINLINRGRAQLNQISQLKDWLSVYAKPALDQAFPEGRPAAEDNQAGVASTMNLLISLMDADGLCELGRIIIQKENDFVEKYFDIGWVIDAAGKVMKYQPALKRLTSGFFGRTA